MKTVEVFAGELERGELFTYSGREYRVSSVEMFNGIVSISYYGGKYAMDFYDTSIIQKIETVRVGQSHLGVNHLLVEGFNLACNPQKTEGYVLHPIERVDCGKCKRTKAYKELA